MGKKSEWLHDQWTSKKLWAKIATKNTCGCSSSPYQKTLHYFTKLHMPTCITPLPPPLAWQERFSIFLDATQAHNSCYPLPLKWTTSYQTMDPFPYSICVPNFLQFCNYKHSEYFQNIKEPQTDYLKQKNHAGSIKIAVIIFAIRLAEEKELSLKIYKEIKLIKKIPTSLTWSKRSAERQ